MLILWKKKPESRGLNNLKETSGSVNPECRHLDHRHHTLERIQTWVKVKGQKVSEHGKKSRVKKTSSMKLAVLPRIKLCTVNLKHAKIYKISTKGYFFGISETKHIMLAGECI